MRLRPTPLLALALVSCVSTPEADQPPRSSPPAAAAAPERPSAVPLAPSRPADPPPGDADSATTGRVEIESAPAPTEPGSKPPQDAETARLRELAHAAIDRGDYVGALALIHDILTEPRIAQARALLVEGRDAEALAITQEVLAVAPAEPRALLVHAEASLRVGARTGARDRVEEALRAFQSAAPSAEAWLGATRAARQLGKTNEALEAARNARAALAAGGASLQAREAPELTIARALWEAHDSAVRAATASEELARETEEALARLVGAQPGERWAWLTLADVQARRGDLAAAQATLERGFQKLPGDAELSAKLRATALERGGHAEAIAAFERVRPSATASPDTWWIPASERFERALALEPNAAIDELRIAEGEFAAARALDAALRAEATRMEALCRAATGWKQRELGRLSAAAECFRSMEKRERGAMVIELPGKVESGVTGLATLAQDHEAKGEPIPAAQLNLELHRYQPDVLKWAVEAGRLYRAIAEEAHANAEDFQLAADDRIREPRRLLALRDRAGIDATIPLGPRLQTELRVRAEDQRKRAQKGFENAYKALLDASRLAPDNVRVMADAALIAVEYLRSDTEIARGLLRTAIALGDKQLANPALSERDRARLKEAWGDAHEYMGLLYLERDGDPRRALEYFQRSLDIGPSPRPSVSDTYIPRCQKALPQRQ
jgi:tetratricopeptide (TPR) repeat protein